MKHNRQSIINESQKDYLHLLLTHQSKIDVTEPKVEDLAALLDDVELFWRARIIAIDLELESTVRTKTCSVLCGAVYLDVTSQQRYYFKFFGDVHIVSDPFLKLEPVIRNTSSDEAIGIAACCRRAFLDTIELLTTYGQYFYVLPIWLLAFEDKEKWKDLLDEFFWKFVSSVFGETFENPSTFARRFRTYEEMEENMNPGMIENLVFTDMEDAKLSLREKIEHLDHAQAEYTSIFAKGTEASRFLIALFSHFSQIMDSLMVCVALNVRPYLRSDVVSNYLMLIMRTFSENPELRNIIEFGLFTYAVNRVAPQEMFRSVDFCRYAANLAKRSTIAELREHLSRLGIDLIGGSIKGSAKSIADFVESVVNAV